MFSMMLIPIYIPISGRKDLMAVYKDPLFFTSLPTSVIFHHFDNRHSNGNEVTPPYGFSKLSLFTTMAIMFTIEATHSLLCLLGNFVKD
jgi:hypothetical protein